MKGIILFKSKYGATRRYAQWLAEDTGFPCRELDQVRPEELQEYETIVFGGGIHASGIAGISFFRKNLASLAGKRLFIFCVGASPYEEEALSAIAARNLRQGLEGVPLFYCRGAWDLDAMDTKDRMMCKLLRKVVAKKPEDQREVWMKALMAAGDEACDWTDRAYLKPLLDALHQLEEGVPREQTAGSLL